MNFKTAFKMFLILLEILNKIPKKPRNSQGFLL